MGRFVVAALVVLVLGACTRPEPPSAMEPPERAILDLSPGPSVRLSAGNGWALASSMLDDAPLPVVDGWRSVLAANDVSLSGWSACSTYRGSIDGDLIDLHTERHPSLECLENVGVEAGLFDALDRVTRIERRDGQLVLTGSDVALTFSPLDPVDDDVFDREWSLSAWVPTLQTDLVPVVAPSTLLIHSDGRFEGTSGCGAEISGIWEPRGDGLHTPIFDISAPCFDGDEAVVDQHGWVTMMGAGIRPVLTADGRMEIVIGVGANDRVSLVYE